MKYLQRRICAWLLLAALPPAGAQMADAPGAAPAAQVTPTLPDAASQTVPSIAPEQNRNFNITDDPLNRRETPSWLAQPQPQQKKPVALTEEQLLAKPELLGRLMLTALLQQNIAAVRVLYPIYIKWPGHDPLMAEFAAGEIARADGDFDTAVAKYHAILDKDSSLSMVRFSLAIALYVDNQLGPARREFDALAVDPKTPEGFHKMIDMFQAGIKKQTGWKLSTSFSYLSDPNVNNGPDQRYLYTSAGVWTLPEKQSAHGFKYYAGLAKDTALDDHFYWRNQAYVFGKSYWDNHDYDDIYSRLSSGVAWRSARHDVALMPFYAYRWFGTDPYSHTTGLRLQDTWTINRNWQLMSALEYGRMIYRSPRQYLDGHSLSASLSVVHRLSDRQYVVVGADIGKQTAADNSDAYDYQGVRLGHVFVWPLGVTSQIEASATVRKYRALNFFNVKELDQDYSATLSLWKNDWSWYGFTPRLTFSYRKVNSNYVVAEYTKKQVGIEIKKDF